MIQQSLRQIKSRIRGIENVKKVTHAMEMISVAKFKPLETRVAVAKNYFTKLEELLKNLLASSALSDHPFIAPRKDVKDIILCLVTSDTGLCGPYNMNVLRAADAFVNERGKEKVSLVPVGRKGLNYFKRKGVGSAAAFMDLHGRYSDDTASALLNTLTRGFSSNKACEVYAAYTRFDSASRHRVVIEKFLNISPPEGTKIDYILEPDIEGILDELLPLYLYHKVRLILINSFAAEHAARMLAMGESTNNAKELLEGLILWRNKVRQANITKEIMEIVSSAEVLK
jgi:F-type H+-transporting ATPase subunit gamma